MDNVNGQPNPAPLASLDQWEDDLLERYPDPANINKEKSKTEFRNYEAPPRDTVKEFYRLNHTYQSYAFVKEKEQEFLSFNKREMSVWDAFDFLNQLVDDSDPDTDLDQFQHLLQTSEAIRADGHPDWMVLTGLFHDMGKVLCLFGEPQWAVVGDTFPHREHAYGHLMNAHDVEMFKWVDLFNPYDLYSKSPTPPDWKVLKPYYEDLVAKYLPSTLKF
ncbi:hypothetical protein HA402_014015 [Bradysia odoriphaga]|nr:hypothetical protein HA402_014015 [Bradysia odoriphaga]